MNIKQLIAGMQSPLKMKNKSSDLQNPYVAGSVGRKEWNDRYMNMAKSLRHWQMAFFMAMSVMILLGCVIVKIATESSVQPFIVETNNGMPYAIKSMESGSLHDQRLINFAINQFIVNARTIVSDPAAEKMLLNKVYAFSANDTLDFLHDYYQRNNPFNLSAYYTVTVTIVNALPLSHDTWQITWDETKHSANGDNVLNVTRWMANVTYKLGEVNPRFITDNPFGLYITHVAWSESQGLS